MMDFKIAVIGGGNIGSAIVKRFSGRISKPENILLIEIDPHKRKEIEKNYSIHTTDKIGSQLKNYDVILIAVKPSTVKEVLLKLASHINEDCLLISVAAGITMHFIEKQIGSSVSIVRTMPNIAAGTGEAAVALSYNQHVSGLQKRRAHTVMESIGRVIEVKEGQLDAVTGLSGSGPAFVFLMIEALADGGVLMGLSRDQSIFLSVQTVFGAAKLLQKSGEHPAVLREKVTTPGGTTAEGLLTLEQGGFRLSVINAVKNATEKAKQIGETLNSH